MTDSRERIKKLNNSVGVTFLHLFPKMLNIIKQTY